MSGNDEQFLLLKRFRVLAVGLTLLVSIFIAATSWFFNPVLAHGVLLGGLAGVLGFWIIAIRLEKIALLNPEKVQFAALTWSAYRFALYGIVLYKTFTLDEEKYHGLIGGLIGIMVIRFVLVFIGATGLDKRLWKNDSSGKVSEYPDEPKDSR